MRINMTVMPASTITRAKPLSPWHAPGAGACDSAAARGLPGSGVTLHAREHPLDVRARLRIRRDAAVPRHRALSRVVGGQGPLDVPAVAGDERAQVPGAAVDVLGGVEGVLDPE